MARGARWGRYLRFWRRDVGSDVDEELAFHFEERIQQFVGEGLSRDAAEAKARGVFGNVAGVRMSLISIGKRSGRRRDRARWVDGVMQDLRFALRGIKQRPLATAVIIATLGTAIGATTAMFGVVNAVLWHPVAGEAVDRLVVVRDETRALNLHDAPVAVGEALDLIAMRDAFSQAAGTSTADRYLSTDREAQHVLVASTIGSYFDVFGVRPSLGHFYVAGAAEDGANVAVLSDAAWKRLFGGDSRIIGRPIEVDGERYRVLGVAPGGFDFPRGVDLWVPQRIVPGSRAALDRGSLSVTFIGRPADGLSIGAVQRRLTLESRRWEERFGAEWYPVSYQRGMLVRSFADFLAGRLRPISLMVMCAVGAVLLIACVNIAGLQLARMTTRRTEIAVRVALGASAGTVARLLAVESLVVGACGASVGLSVAGGLLAAIRRSAALDHTIVGRVHINAVSVAFSVATTLGAVLAAGLWPALRLVFIDGREAWRGASTRTVGRPRSERFVLDGAVVVQFALALALVTGALLAVRSLRQLLAVDPGFRPSGVLAAELTVPASRYPTPAAKAAFQAQLLERVRALPGVSAVGTAYGLPFSGLGTSSTVRLVDRPRDASAPDQHASLWFIGGDYFATLGIPVLRGRGFTADDAESGVRVAVIDAAFATQIFPGQDPIGRQVEIGRPATIIGVVGSVKHGDVSDVDSPAVYLSYRQSPGAIRTISVVARSARVDDTRDELARAVADVDRTVELSRISTMQQRIADSMGSRRLASVTLDAFAAAATLLAILGIYGMLSFTTAQRTHEIGIRLALGADAGRVGGIVLRRGIGLAAAGVAVGVCLSLASGQLLSALLFRVGARGPGTLIASSVALLGVAALGSWAPARRAARVAPVDLMRTL